MNGARSMLLLLMAGLVAGGLASPLSASDRPNVVVFIADDLGWKDVGYHGSEIRTPNIDRLVREGVELDRFYGYSMCTPTRTAFMTGRSPLRMGITGPIGGLMDGIPLDEHLLPQSFKQAGYQTFATGKWHVGGSHVNRFPTSRGFDHFYGFLSATVDYFTHCIDDGRLDWQRDGKSVREEGYATDLLAREAITLLKGREKSRPVFLYVAFGAVHAPLQAPQELIDRYADIEDPDRRTYAAMVEAMDAAIGRVLAAVDGAGLRSNTLVVLFSDNGGARAGNNTPLREGKGTVFEGGIRLPALFYWPGTLKAGSKVKQAISAHDLFPTLAAAAGIPVLSKKPLDGRDMWAAIHGGKILPKRDFLIGARGAYALFHDDWKLVRTGLAGPGSPTSYLFKIENDPYEKTDLSARHPELVKQLSAQHAGLTKALSAAGAQPGGPAGGRRGLLRFDQDEDGIILKSEVPETDLEPFMRADSNHDGRVDAGELAANRAKMGKGKAGKKKSPAKEGGDQTPLAEAARRDGGR